MADLGLDAQTYAVALALLQCPRPPQLDIFQSFAEEDGAIVGGAMQNMNDYHLCVVNAVEDQVVAVNASTDAITFIARDEGKAVGVIDEILTLAPQLPDE